ncbi:PQQ-like beta-propeller repeat protein [Pseudenhygromyxa sp. WMMC2535]|uniref:PQQ-like beta-propeller repeat protein n=1 Tax=Pseudenhygromyxa sp. WMMC2535 TaxID=2712867 RepID=UPI00159604F2|nr:PQQ-like beta-propeller repeat protein [Pseudenhygromyxa sp. WMMC2535]NVB39310.1 PQQ-like beta-propeller repeat protein [Pseudenhygromyxa sp. WMMC2535]
MSLGPSRLVLALMPLIVGVACGDGARPSGGAAPAAEDVLENAPAPENPPETAPAPEAARAPDSTPLPLPVGEGPSLWQAPAHPASWKPKRLHPQSKKARWQPAWVQTHPYHRVEPLALAWRGPDELLARGAFELRDAMMRYDGQGRLLATMDLSGIDIAGCDLGSPVVASNLVAIAVGDEGWFATTLQCMDGHDGLLIFDHDGRLTASLKLGMATTTKLLALGRRLFVLTRDLSANLGELVAYDLDGHARWRRSFAFAPRVLSAWADAVVVDEDLRRLISLDIDTGDERATFDVDGIWMAAVAIDGGPRAGQLAVFGSAPLVLGAPTNEDEPQTTLRFLSSTGETLLSERTVALPPAISSWNAASASPSGAMLAMTAVPFELVVLDSEGELLGSVSSGLLAFAAVELEGRLRIALSRRSNPELHNFRDDLPEVGPASEPLIIREFALASP